MISEIFKLLVALAVTIDKPQTKERLMIYCKYLAEFPIEKIEESLNWHMINSKFFPQLSEIRERIIPKQDTTDRAMEMAGAIIDSVRQFGSHQVIGAKKHLGNIAWFAIERFGGWQSLCTHTCDQLPTIRAQLRDTCKAVLSMQNRPPESCTLEYQKHGQAELNNSEHLEKLNYNL